ncbi:MAG: Gfo/Idh/MocA family oxidoreductase [Isosphaeraceae bacterium]|nr:Gfo/Idh/MocA family oxidoreductase [Isosphaeraceae bacterium]
MSHEIDRRGFLGAAGAALLSSRVDGAVLGANDKLVVGVMGTGGRGTSLAESFSKETGVEVAYVCDVDSGRAGKAADLLSKLEKPTPKVVGDFRRILDDKAVDLLVIAAADHWHAPATILACSAGKHVYVEKPCSHNPREGEWMVEAARKHDRVVQLGTQRRSWPGIIEGMQAVHSGEIGRAYLATCRYAANRGSIGVGKAGTPPADLDYELWQGPAPRRPFRDNYLHYNWHWFWHWGTGEIGNNGVHYLDLCRWALQVDYPTRVSSSGGRYHFRDDQETPDTHFVGFDFEGGKSAVFEGVSCSPWYPGTPGNEIVIHGDKGSLSITNTGCTIRDLSGKKTLRTTAGKGGDAVHIADFLSAVREKKRPHAEIEEGHKSTLLCHLGNIAHRVGRSLTCDPKNGRILGDAAAAEHWGREYAPGWEPKV